MTKANKKPNLILIMIIYIAGIFMGAIDTGIVTPARTVIQANLNVNEQTGIWMITIYTLAYAASIPIMGKLADKFGRKYVYLISIFLFGFGSLFCGLSQDFGSFTILLIARAVQAIGGGGILPVATAEFGTSFPEEKRGLALGLVGGAYGIANVFGASAGSAILDIFGKDNWQFIFYINIPITIFILISGFLTLPNSKSENTSRIDFAGIITLTIMILSLLYGLRNIDFFDIKNTITNTNVLPFLIAFVVLIPLFIVIEKKVKDPVMNLKYFTNKNIVITLLISFVSGFVMMGMIFIPQFSENALKIASGSGGYFVIILGAFAGLGAPMSGKLIDKFGEKLILGFGFLASILGSLFLVLVATENPNLINVIISLILIGLGIGFTMGTPINYMMLKNTDDKESNSALATVSLIRSIGTAIAPAIMVGFLAHAGASIQTNVMNQLPNEISVPPLPYSQEISEKLNELKENPQMKDKLADMKMPDLNSMQTVKIDFNKKDSNYKMPEDLLELMKNSDVTTITKNSKTLADRMFSEMTPDIIKNITDGIDKGIDGINTGTSQMESAVSKMQQGYDGMTQGIAGMQQAIDGQKQALAQLQQVAGMFASMGNRPLPPNMTIADMIPANIKSKVPQQALEELSKIKSVDELNAKIDELNSGIAALTAKLEETQNSQQAMATSSQSLNNTIFEMSDLSNKMTEMKNAVPSAFETAKQNYLKEIDNRKSSLEKSFQKTLDDGFKNVYLTTTIAGAAALLLLIFYTKKKKVENK